MIIGGYADPHLSLTSSILPSSSKGSKYSERLQMIINSYEWMYDKFGKDVDLIFNHGDTTDTPHMRVEESSALSDCYAQSKKVPEYHIIGNHERLDKDDQFYSPEILKRISHIHIVDKPMILKNEFGLLPYTTEVSDELLKSIKSKVLISHIDIAGSAYHQLLKDTVSIEPYVLETYFQMVLNGHLHGRQFITDKVINVGSLVSHNFSDYYAGGLPGIYILDTSTMRIEFFENPHAILFYKKYCDDLSSLITYLDSLDQNRRYALQVTVPYEKRDQARDLISGKPFIITSRITGKVASATVLKESEVQKLAGYGDGMSALVGFINDTAEFSYPKSELLDYVNTHVINKDGTTV